MAWYYDLVVLAILALCVWNGMRKGVSRSLLQTAATILSTVVALWVSQPLAELCYTEFLEKPVVVDKYRDRYGIYTVRNKKEGE